MTRGATRIHIRLLTIVLLVSVLSSSLVCRNRRPNSEKLNDLPVFNTEDIRGAKINSRELGNSPLFIHFLDAKHPDHINLLNHIHHDFMIRGLNIVVFTDDFPLLEKKLGSVLNGIHIVDREIASYKDLFGVPICCDTYYLYNQGRLIRSGYSWEDFHGELRGVLNSIFGHAFSLDDFFRQDEFSDFSESFTRFCRNSEGRASSNLLVVSFFNEICNGCMSGRTFQDLIRASKEFGHAVHFETVLSREFTEQDVENLKLNFYIGFELRRADEELDSTWNRLLRDHGKSHLGVFFLFFDKECRILHVMNEKNYENPQSKILDLNPGIQRNEKTE